MEFVGSEPEIWRRFEFLGSLALSQVHQVLQSAFGWEDAHLTCTGSWQVTRSRRCGAVKGEFLEVLQWLPEQQCEELGDRPEEGCTLEQLLVLGSGGGFYVYDFGDSWLHHLELVSRRPADENSLPAR